MTLQAVVVDYGMGNLRSVEKALEMVGADVVVTRDPGMVREARILVLPGVGAFKDCMSNLDKFKLIDPVRDRILADVPFLGICLGYQLLFDESEEFGRQQGLGIIKGKVVRFSNDMEHAGARLKIPHMGWNRVKKIQDGGPLANLEDDSYFYFVHSYYPVPENPDVVATTTNYGIEFASSVRKGNLFACQFHPEKSQKVGLSLLDGFWNFAKSKANI